MTRTLVAFASAMLAATGALAAELTPGSGHSLDLGGFTGVVYFTVEHGGYRVVATIAEEAGMPVRFVSMLADGEAMAISVPREEGQAEDLLEIARAGDRLLVSRRVRKDDVVTMSTQLAGK